MVKLKKDWSSLSDLVELIIVGRKVAVLYFQKLSEQNVNEKILKG